MSCSGVAAVDVEDEALYDMIAKVVYIGGDMGIKIEATGGATAQQAVAAANPERLNAQAADRGLPDIVPDRIAGQVMAALETESQVDMHLGGGLGLVRFRND